MSDFNVRSDSVDVEQIMRQIRARIREKRGADYTESEIQQLAKVKLEKFLDPKGVRSDLVDQFKRREYTPSPPLPKLEIKDFSIYGTHRGLLQSIRKLLQPVLKLFVNPNPLVHFVWTQAHAQAEINEEINRWMRRREQLDAKMEPLSYELMHNLVVELTRNSIEVHNLKMRVESLSSRLDFDERRSRSLERVVEYRPQRQQSAPQAPQAPQGGYGQPSQTPAAEGTRPEGGRPDGGRPDGGGRPDDAGGGEGRRRRRRRRRRRPGQTMAGTPGTPGTTGTTGTTGTEGWDANERERVSPDERSGDHGAPASESDGGFGGAEPPDEE